MERAQEADGAEWGRRKKCFGVGGGGEFHFAFFWIFVRLLREMFIHVGPVASDVEACFFRGPTQSESFLLV